MPRVKFCALHQISARPLGVNAAKTFLVRIAAVGGICKVHDGGRIAFKQIERQTAKERVRGGVIR